MPKAAQLVIVRLGFKSTKSRSEVLAVESIILNS